MNISADKVKQIRKQKGWTQEVLSKVTGLSLRTVQRLEREGGGSSETLLALASAFEVETGQLFAEYRNPPSKWSKEKIMHGIIAIVVFWGAISFLMILGGELKMFFDVYSLLFMFFFTWAGTLVAFGVDGLLKSLFGLKYLFSGEIESGKATERLQLIFKNQILFCYGAAFVGLLVGTVAIHGNPEMTIDANILHRAYAVNILLVLYSALYCEVILRPLKTKLAVSQLG